MSRFTELTDMNNHKVHVNLDRVFYISEISANHTVLHLGIFDVGSASIQGSSLPFAKLSVKESVAAIRSKAGSAW